MTASQPSPAADGRIRTAEERSWRARVRSATRLIEVRLRIPLILLASALVVGRWDLVRNYWDKLTRRAVEQSSASHPVSNDTEYFCPMDPGVVSDWPGKCGICNMALVRRKRGEAVALPDGVVARMQLSPYRVQLAGIQSAPLTYRPLVRSYRAAGVVGSSGEALVVSLAVPGRSASWLAEVATVQVSSKDLPEKPPLAGKLELDAHARGQGGDDFKASIGFTDPSDQIRPGMIADVSCDVPLSRLQPFRSMPADLPAIRPGEPRQVYACPEHRETRTEKPGRCPIDGNALEAFPLADNQRLRWWCPMHPAVTADHAGEKCQQCGGMQLQPRVLAYAPAGMVLAVPESAVIDTGLRTVVFVETMPGMFDGVEVALGPRCEGFYPVIRGLEAGQRVAVSGAFLLDAETRLNPSLAASYFGATAKAASAPASGTMTVARSSAEVPGTGSPLEKLDPADRLLAARQKNCPVTGKALGSMGTPVRVMVSGQVVFLCCSGCEDALRTDPAKYLVDVPAGSRP
jgi:hypothetical protein